MAFHRVMLKASRGEGLAEGGCRLYSVTCNQKEEVTSMLDMPTAMKVTLNCIRKVAGLFPEADFPISPGDTLI